MGGNIVRNKTIEEFEKMIFAMVENTPIPTLEDRYKYIEDINEEYLDATGNVLPPFLLSVLTDWVLAETLKDKDVCKVTNNEFAILSHRQIKRRLVREPSVEDDVLNYLQQKYVKQQSSLAKRLKKDAE